MRPDNRKRSRGRNGRRPSAPSRTQTFDSHGPEVRIRGTAHQVYDGYLRHARDAAAMGDRIRAESLLQHAEHYFRIIASFNEQDQRRFGPNGQPHDMHGGPNGEHLEADDEGDDYEGSDSVGM